MALSNSRLEYIDLFRAFGILSMIIGHVGFGKEINHFVHVYHMPMFFLISGYFFKSQPLTKLIIKRAKTLLLPYLFWGLLHIIIYFFTIGRIDVHAFYLMFWENTAESGIPIAGALWFLTAIFVSEVIFWFVQKIKANIIVETVISTAIAVAGIACATYLPFRLPFAIDVGMVGVLFFQFGKLLNEKFNRLLSLNLLLSILAVIVFSVLGFVNEYVNLRKGIYGIWILFILNAVGLTIAFMNLFRFIYNASANSTN